MTVVRFLRPAEIEMNETAVYYEMQAEELGDLFLRTLESAVEEIRANPRAWPVLRQNVRKRGVPRFPYSVLYRVDADEIVVVAVMHQRRHPEYWVGRI